MSIERVTVIGAGTMGHGIAQVAAMAGCEVCLNDVSEAAVAAGLGRVGANLDKGVARGKVDADQRDATLARLTTNTDLGRAVAAADLVVEAVPEDLDLKRRLLAAIAAGAPATAIVATNTSSLPLSQMSDVLVHAERFVGLHFFNPVHLQPLVEVIVSEATSAATRDAALAFIDRLGKESIVVRDVAGFATSRLGLVIGLEAIRMVEEGVASAADIDKAMRLGYRHPMGPLELTDLVGLDVRLAIAETLARELDPVRFAPPRLLRELVAQGKLGRKSGEGFYRYP